MWQWTYLEDGSATTKYEINGALNITRLVVMSTFVIKECVVCTVKCTMIKCCFFCCTNAATDWFCEV